MKAGPAEDRALGSALKSQRSFLPAYIRSHRSLCVASHGLQVSELGYHCHYQLNKSMLLELLCALEGLWQHPGFCLLAATPHLGCSILSNVAKCLLGMEPLISLRFISLMTTSSIQFASVASAHT